MTGLIANLPGVQAALDNLAERHRVPGASLAILDGDETIQATTGVTSRATGVAVTTDTLFQIGSITKVYTTTMVMQLVDEGKVELDKALSHYLPDLKLKEPSSPDVITVGQLLNHTSGIVGDFFDDHGRGDDCVAKYVAALAEQVPTHPPGLMFSYCNAGFVVAGYLIEQVTGKPFHEVFDERLRKPLGLRDTTILGEEMLAYRYAVGHVDGKGSWPEPAPAVLMPRSSVPAGSRTSATPLDVLRFARLHLDGGVAADGTRRLSEASVRLMQTPSVDCVGDPDSNFGRGWLVSTWDGARMMGHNGGTYGQLAFLYILPDQHFAVCLLTNADTGGELWRDLGRWLFKEFAGIDMPRPPKPLGPGHGIDLAPYAGTYERISNRYVVEADGEQLKLTWTTTEEGEDPEPQHLRLDPIDRGRFLARLGEMQLVVSFLEFDEAGRPEYIHTGSRAAARVAETAELASA